MVEYDRKVGWVRLVGYGRVWKLREWLVDVLIDTRYFTEWPKCLPYGSMGFFCLRRSVLDCVNTVIRNWLNDTQKLMMNYGFKMKALGVFFEGSIVTPLIVQPTLSVHVNNKRCLLSFCQGDTKRRSCRSEYSINR